MTALAYFFSPTKLWFYGVITNIKLKNTHWDGFIYVIGIILHYKCWRISFLLFFYNNKLFKEYEQPFPLWFLHCGVLVYGELIYIYVLDYNTFHILFINTKKHTWHMLMDFASIYMTARLCQFNWPWQSASAADVSLRDGFCSFKLWLIEERVCHNTIKSIYKKVILCITLNWLKVPISKPFLVIKLPWSVFVF